MSPRRALATAVAGVAVLVAACSPDPDPVDRVPPDSSTSAASASPTGPPGAAPSVVATDDPTSAGGPALSVTIVGDEVRVNTESVEVARGQELLVEISSDRAGELRIDTDPMQYLIFGVETLPFRPSFPASGTFSITDFETGLLVAEVEAR